MCTQGHTSISCTLTMHVRVFLNGFSKGDQLYINIWKMVFSFSSTSCKPFESSWIFLILHCFFNCINFLMIWISQNLFNHPSFWVLALFPPPLLTMVPRAILLMSTPDLIYVTLQTGLAPPALPIPAKGFLLQGKSNSHCYFISSSLDLEASFEG